jgi:hypothetical protein
MKIMQDRSLYRQRPSIPEVNITASKQDLQQVGLQKHNADYHLDPNQFQHGAWKSNREKPHFRILPNALKLGSIVFLIMAHYKNSQTARNPYHYGKYWQR